MSHNESKGTCNCNNKIAKQEIKVKDIVECKDCKGKHSENCDLIDYELYYLAWLCENCLIEKHEKRWSRSWKN